MAQMGKLIRQKRRMLNLTQERLGDGLISKAELSRIENGQKEPDIFVLNALVHRLGESLEHFEIVVTGAEYELVRLRRMIQISLQMGEFAEVEKYLEEYEASRESGKPLHLEYMETVKEAVKEKLPEVAPKIPGLPQNIISEIDLLKDIRKAKGWSQEQFSSDVCARETISCIENGRTPNHKMLRKLLEKRGVTWKNYYGYVEAEDFKTYRMVQEYLELAHNNEKDAERLLKEIKKRLDVSIPVNQQFLEGSGLLRRVQKEGMNPQILLEDLERCLRLTMPEYDGMLHRIPYREEVKLLYGIIECMKRLNYREEAESLQLNLTKKLGKRLKVS